MAVKVKIKSEQVLFNQPAKIEVYEDDRLVTTIIAKVGLQKGADGGSYHCVTLEKQ